jgi:hypothetical protein
MSIALPFQQPPPQVGASPFQPFSQPPLPTSGWVQQPSPLSAVQNTTQAGTAAGATGAGGRGGALSKAAATRAASAPLRPWLPPMGGQGAPGVSSYAGPGAGFPGATPNVATPSMGGPGIPGLSSYAGPSPAPPGLSSPLRPGLPAPPAPPPPKVPWWSKDLSRPKIPGRLGQAARGGGGIAALVAGQAIAAQGDNMDNDFLRAAGGGMSLSPLLAAAPGMSAVPAAGVVAAGAGLGNLGGRELTERLPDQIANMEQKSNVELAAANPFLNPVAGMEALDRFGDYIGVDNFGNFKDKAREGQRTLSDVARGIPFVGDMFGGGSGEDPAVAQAAAQAAAQTAARQSLTDPATMQQFLSDYGMSPEGGQAAMGEYQEMLSRNRALAERGMLPKYDDADNVLKDDKGNPVLVTPDEVEDFTLNDWSRRLGAMAQEDAAAQQLMSQAAAWQAQLGPQYDAAIAQQEVLNGAYQAALDANPYLPDNMRAAFQQYFDVAGAGQMQGLNDIRMQGIGLPAMQALQEQQAISDQVRQREIQQYIDGMFATESGGAGSGLNIDIFGDGN